MAVYYVRSTTGNDTNSGVTWNLAMQTITGALTSAQPGDIIYVSQAHNFYTAGTITYPGAIGTPKLPVSVICVQDNAMPPTQLANTAIELSLTNNIDITFDTSSYIYWYGITFSCMRTFYHALNCTQIFDKCTFRLANTSSGGYINFYVGNTLFGGFDVRYVNCTFSFANAACTFYFYGSGKTYNSPTFSTLNFKSCTLTGTAPTSLFSFDANYPAAMITATSCDFSIINNPNALVNLGGLNASTYGSKLYLRNCKLGYAWSWNNSSFTTPGQMEIIWEDCEYYGRQRDTGYWNFQGNTLKTTSIYKVGGATDGIAPYSISMQSNTTNPFPIPLYTMPISTWIGSIGAPVTAEIAMMCDLAPPNLPNYISFGTNNYIDVQTSNDWIFSTNDWTIDYYFMIPSLPATNTYEIAASFGVFNTTGFDCGLFYNSSSVMYLHMTWSNTAYDVTCTINPNVWYHAAFVRNYNYLYSFLNGALLNRFDITGKTVTSNTCRIGANSSGQGAWLGQLSSFRVSPGISRWTSNFTPPKPYTIDENTKLFIKPSSTTITDDATSKTMTIIGTVPVTLASQLTTNDMCGEVEYQGVNTAPISSFVKNTNSLFPLTTAPVTYPTDEGAVWNIGDLGNPVYQKMQFQFTPQMQGIASIKLYLIKPGITVYVDPKIVIV